MGGGEGDGFTCNLDPLHAQMKLHSPTACVAWFLTGHGLVLVLSPGIESNSVMDIRPVGAELIQIWEAK